MTFVRGEVPTAAKLNDIETSLDPGLRVDIAAHEPGKGTDQIGHYNSWAPAILRLTSEIINGGRVDFLSWFVDPTKVTDIRNRTSTYDLDAAWASAATADDVLAIHFEPGLYNMAGPAAMVLEGKRMIGSGRNQSELRINDTAEKAVTLANGVRAHGLTGWKISRNGVPVAGANGVEFLGTTDDTDLEDLWLDNHYINYVIGSCDEGKIRGLRSTRPGYVHVLQKNQPHYGPSQWDVDDVLLRLGNYDGWRIEVAPPALVTASIAGTTMTVTAVAQGQIYVGHYISGSGVTPGTYVKTILTGSGGIGTYELSVGQTVASTTITSAVPGMIVGAMNNFRAFGNGEWDYHALGSAATPIYDTRLTHVFFGSNGHGGARFDTYGSGHSLQGMLERSGVDPTGPTLGTAPSNNAPCVQISPNNVDMLIHGSIIKVAALACVHHQGGILNLAASTISDAGQAAVAGTRAAVLSEGGRVVMGADVAGNLPSKSGGAVPSAQLYGLATNHSNVTIAGCDLIDNATQSMTLGATGSEVVLGNATDGATRYRFPNLIDVLRFDQALALGAAGGLKGSGSINAKAVYDDNVLLT